MSTPTKVQYVLWGDASERPADFAARVRSEAEPRLLELGSFALKLTMTDAPPPRLSLFPFRQQPVAVLSLQGRALPEPERCVDVLAPYARCVGAYEVEESIPRAYDRTWPDGERTTGVSLLTLFRRRKGLADADFRRRWFEGHTPLTLRTHPVWCYVRNAVRAPLLPDSPPLDGIVEEHFRMPSDLLHPARFYGGALRMLPNMARVALDVAGFIDLRTIETYLATEIHLRS